MALDSILSAVQAYHCQHVCVTGGEPLAQPACRELLRQLAELGYHVSLETSGALDIANLDPRITIVMDLKTPDSGECHTNLLRNIDSLKASDQVKFVICSAKDYDWARNMIDTYALTKKALVLFSPSWQQINPTVLADWIVRDQLDVRFQLQLHKLLWQDTPGH